MFYKRPIKTVLDFKVKFFDCCSISFGVYTQSLVDTPIGFYIIQNKLKMRKM